MNNKNILVSSNEIKMEIEKQMFNCFVRKDA